MSKTRIAKCDHGMPWDMCDLCKPAPNASSFVRCGREKRKWAGSCNACQCRDEDTVIVVYLNTLTFRACNKCAAEIAAQLNRLAPNNPSSAART